ncbi:cation transporter [bacterium]|nr:cation transporter [bacterium]
MRSLTVQTYQAQLKRVTWLGVFCNVFLASLKILFGKLGHSHSLFADGIHSLSDLVTDAALLLGSRFWSEPADEAHPYGHSKLEALVTFFIGCLLFAVGFRILINALMTFGCEELVFSWMMVAVAAVSVITKEILYHITYRLGVKLESQALKANAWHHRTDALSSLPVLIVLLLTRVFPKWYFLDNVGGILVSFMIFYAAFEIVRGAFDALIDRGLPPETLERIRRTALRVPGVKLIHAVRSRVNGNVTFLDMHILVDKDMTVYESHRLAHTVRDILVDKYSLSDVLIHVEPFTEEEKEETTC